MHVFVFGSMFDQQAWNLSKKLEKKLPGFKFLRTENVNDLLSFRGEVTILDVVKNIDAPAILGIGDLKEKKISTLHDFDLGFFLQVMKKTGRIKEARIIGIPEQFDDGIIDSVCAMLSKQ